MPHRNLIGATLTATVMLLAATIAHAHGAFNRPFVLPTGPVTASVARPALRLAQRVWHPACGNMTLQAEPPPSIPTPTEDIGTISGWATPGDCVIHVNAKTHWLGGPDLCETVLHEAGHVAGFHENGGPDNGAHSADPNNIMYPQQFVMKIVGRITDRHGRVHRHIWWGGIDRRCLRVYR